MHQLPIREFAYLFQIKWSKLKTNTTQYLKSWFVKIRLGRELYNDTKLLYDEFSEKGPLRYWAGLENKNTNEIELNKAIKRELRLGINTLPPDKYITLFDEKDMYTETYTIDEKISWFLTVRKAREHYQDPDSIIDAFSVKGPLRKWIGLSD